MLLIFFRFISFSYSFHSPPLLIIEGNKLPLENLDSENAEFITAFIVAPEPPLIPDIEESIVGKDAL